MAVAIPTPVDDDDDDDDEPDDVPVKFVGPVAGYIVGERYKVLKQLGEGGFGAVYEVADQKSHELYAMKVELEKPPPDEPGLPLEGQVMKMLQGHKNILRYISGGVWGPQKVRFLVMQLAGPSLENRRKKSPNFCLSNKTIVQLAIQCLECVVVMHAAGLLHRDIKPANYALGYTEKERRTVFILDFGLVRRFMKEGKLRPSRKRAGFRGSIQYASVNAHFNKDLGRADDLWCWLYSLVHMRTANLPWRNFNGKAKVGKMKFETKREVLLAAMEREFDLIHDSMKTLKYEDLPPYRTYQEQLEKIMTRLKITRNEPFDWEVAEQQAAAAKKAQQPIGDTAFGMIYNLFQYAAGGAAQPAVAVPKTAGVAGAVKAVAPTPVADAASAAVVKIAKSPPEPPKTPPPPSAVLKATVANVSAVETAPPKKETVAAVKQSPLNQPKTAIDSSMKSAILPSQSHRSVASKLPSNPVLASKDKK